MKVSVGDVLRLTAKTSHARNRLKAQGVLWRVLRQGKTEKNTLFPEGTEAIWLESTRTKDWRIIKEKGDDNFIVDEVIYNELID